MHSTRAHILKHYGIAPEAQLSSGMEAEVYAYGPDAVLKLYVGTTSRTDLLTLQDFYNGLDRQRVPYALPRIYSVAEEADVLLTIEQRLAGTQLSTLLPTLPPGRLEGLMQRYLAAGLALAPPPPPPTFDRYKLFGPNHMSLRAAGDWHRFLVR